MNHYSNENNLPSTTYTYTVATYVSSVACYTGDNTILQETKLQSLIAWLLSYMYSPAKESPCT